jgi:hypothetical protein
MQSGVRDRAAVRKSLALVEARYLITPAAENERQRRADRGIVVDHEDLAHRMLAPPIAFAQCANRPRAAKLTPHAAGLR